jgi:hypothetical protein
MTAAIQYKVLGQLDLGAASATTVYTVPNTAGNYAVVSSIVVANRVATPNTFRLWVAVASAGDDVKQYIA